MPTFDVVSEVEKHDLTNAVDQANRVVTTRFDFKGVDAKFERNDFQVVITAEAEFQVTQMLDILKSSLHKNGIDVACLQESPPKTSGQQVKQEIVVRSGLDSETCKSIVKLIKDSKLKVQAQIQSDQVRVIGKKRDDLQAVIQLLKESKVEMPLQFSNFRD
jgi:hypothetical protein